MALHCPLYMNLIGEVCIREVFDNELTWVDWMNDDAASIGKACRESEYQDKRRLFVGVELELLGWSPHCHGTKSILFLLPQCTPAITIDMKM
jgi:hypothetical protein